MKKYRKLLKFLARLNGMKPEGEQNRKLEIEIDPRSVAVVTTTFYPNWYPGPSSESENSDKVRGDLALRMLSEARSKSFQLVVVDGSNNQMFKEVLRRIDINPLPETEKGMSASRQQGFSEAHILEGVKVICWLEPEKVSISRDCLPEAVIPILRGEADIVVPKRNEDLFKKTYPDLQFHKIIKPELWPNAIFFPIIVALHNSNKETLYYPPSFLCEVF